ncbi:hypothetical protein, partial [Neobacillus drentensis]|uniref:hypothetical protein n=1 Tax=Neobacillus drentensis TaxID=220684 RepID=UPI000A530779
EIFGWKGFFINILWGQIHNLLQNRRYTANRYYTFLMEGRAYYGFFLSLWPSTVSGTESTGI